MNREHYEALVSSAGWAPFLQFLLDRRADLAEALASDAIVEADKMKSVQQCIIFKELANLSWKQVDIFYRPDQQETPEDQQ